MVNVHWRTDDFAAWTNTLFENVRGIGVREARKAGKHRRVFSPTIRRVDGRDPDGRALKPPAAIELTLRIPRSMALGAFGDFLHKIFAALQIACRSLFRV